MNVINPRGARSSLDYRWSYNNHALLLFLTDEYRKYKTNIYKIYKGIIYYNIVFASLFTEVDLSDIYYISLW